MNHSYDFDDFSSGKPARSTIQERHLTITRTNAPVRGGGQSMSVVQQSSNQRGYGGGGGGFNGGSSLAAVNSTAFGVQTSRDKEKKDMQDLNERFASYIEKVRFLEAQNRRLGDDTDKLKTKWGKESNQIRALYQAELDEARRLIEAAETDKANLEIKVAALEDRLAELRQRLDDKLQQNRTDRDLIDKQIEEMSSIEAEVNLLRRRSELLEADKVKAKRTVVRLQEAINRARMDTDNETSLHVEAEIRRQALEDELASLKDQHEQELKELSELAYRDTTVENRDMWKSEMGPKMRELQQFYDGKLDTLRGDMDTQFNIKVQEARSAGPRLGGAAGGGGGGAPTTKEEVIRLKTISSEVQGKVNDLESKNAHLQLECDQLQRERDAKQKEMENDNCELKNDLALLQAELSAIQIELQSITDKKLSLEQEINGYRVLLEGEEVRTGIRETMSTTSMSTN